MVHHGSGVPHLPVLLLLLLLVIVRCAESQSTAFPPSSNGSSAGFSATTAVIFVSLLFVFFLLAFFSVYLHRCTDSYVSSGFSASTATATASGGVAAGRERRRGLDPAVVDSFPTMQYAAAKELKGEKGAALECAVCLSEFADDDTLRLLPGCCHVFHPDCIDGWLASHVTCPVCRANLSDPAVLNAGKQIASEDTAEEAAICGLELDPGPMVPAAMELGFRRSQSAVDGVDRFTLRLPDHVRKEMEEVGRLRRVASLAGYQLERRGGGGGEGGARRWRSFLRTISVGRIRGEEGSEGSDKRVFPLNGAPVVGDSSGSASGEKEVSEMAVLNRV